MIDIGIDLWQGIYASGDSLIVEAPSADFSAAANSGYIALIFEDF